MKIFLGVLLIAMCALANEEQHGLFFKEPNSPIKVVKWSSVASGDTTQAYRTNGREIKGFQTTGTRGTATTQLHGSLDGVNYVNLRDTSGNAVSSDSTRVYTVVEKPLYVKPVVVTGNASTDLTIHVLIEK